MGEPPPGEVLRAASRQGQRGGAPERPGPRLRRPRAAHARARRPRLRARGRGLMPRLPAGRPARPRGCGARGVSEQGHRAGHGRVRDRGVPAVRHGRLPHRPRVGVRQRRDRRDAGGVRDSQAALEEGLPTRQRRGRAHEQAARGRARLGGGVRRPKRAPGEAERVRLVVQQRQASLEAGLHEPGRVQARGAESLKKSPEKGCHSTADGVFVRVHFQQGAAPIGVRRRVCLLLFDLFPFSFVRSGAFSDESSQVRNAVLRIEVHENYCAVTNRGLLARIGAREYRQCVV